jgi:hypothetical protein
LPLVSATGVVFFAFAICLVSNNRLAYGFRACYPSRYLPRHVYSGPSDLNSL